MLYLVVVPDLHLVFFSVVLSFFCAELIWETPPLQGGYGGTICPCSLFKSSSRRDAPSILHEEKKAKKSFPAATDPALFNDIEQRLHTALAAVPGSDVDFALKLNEKRRPVPSAKSDSQIMRELEESLLDRYDEERSTFAEDKEEDFTIH